MPFLKITFCKFCLIFFAIVAYLHSLLFLQTFFCFVGTKILKCTHHWFTLLWKTDKKCSFGRELNFLQIGLLQLLPKTHLRVAIIKFLRFYILVFFSTTSTTTVISVITNTNRKLEIKITLCLSVSTEVSTFLRLILKFLWLLKHHSDFLI